jgi:hypothetical protein
VSSFDWLSLAIEWDSEGGWQDESACKIGLHKFDVLGLNLWPDIIECDDCGWNPA